MSLPLVVRAAIVCLRVSWSRARARLGSAAEFETVVKSESRLGLDKRGRFDVKSGLRLALVRAALNSSASFSKVFSLIKFITI